jgi:hypothetical protein
MRFTGKTSLSYYNKIIYRENLMDFENYVKIGAYEEQEEFNGAKDEGFDDLGMGEFDIGAMIE